MAIWCYYGKKGLAFLGVFLGFSAVVFGQPQKSLKPAVYMGLQAGASAGNTTPFWLRANDYGQFPDAPNFVQSDLNLRQDYDSLFQKNSALKPFSMGYGTQVIVQQSNQTRLIMPEAFIKLRYKHWELYVGRKKEIFGLTDTTHTSGSCIWSGNALPMPKIQIHTPKYVAIGKKGRISFNAGISHGWFGKDSLVQGHWLHQKWLYGRIGKPESKVQVTAGINHQVMWGGYSDLLEDGSQYTVTIDGQLAPYPLYSYQYIILPFLQKFTPPDPSKVPGYDGGLAVGNQLGSVDISFQYKGEMTLWLLYKQQPYDFARSLYNLNNIEDGLHGLSVSFINGQFLRNITGEFFYSKSQGRYRFGKYQESNYGEVDNYFFHGQYQSWSYQNQILGTPFIFFEGQNQKRFNNNRLKYYYLSLKGKLKPKLSYTLKQVYSQNFGTYSRSIDLSQYSGSLQLIYQAGSSLISGQFMMDQGRLYDQNIGLSLSWQRQLY
ncbi:capsule assembly Wzi family protein [Jiulongibacter sediminis]|uniref:capsule assembly Wzi family protein n=1 Tax=Jiulongibacter sediminis TaxID=1605367 RepID=UPI0026EF9EEB|nr:capsule assembly Wzi family protein [Jiulongibacter sediminis]